MHETSVFLGQDWSLETLIRSGWRPNRRDLSFGLGPRPGPPPGPAGWTAPPWERDRRGPMEAVSIAVSQDQNAPIQSADGSANSNAASTQPGEARRSDSLPPASAPSPQRSFEWRWRGRRDAR
jgi:hypothetical protein